jgi:hypothetical protein
MTKPLRLGASATRRVTTRKREATCQTCGEHRSAPNALAVGAVHAKAHGHVVKAVGITRITFDGTRGQ